MLVLFIWAIYPRGPFLPVSVSEITTTIKHKFPNIAFEYDLAMNGWIISFPLEGEHLCCFRIHGISGDKCREIEVNALWTEDYEHGHSIVDALIESARLGNRDWTRNRAADFVQKVSSENEVIERDMNDRVRRYGRVSSSLIPNAKSWELKFTAI